MATALSHFAIQWCMYNTNKTCIYTAHHQLHLPTNDKTMCLCDCYFSWFSTYYECCLSFPVHCLWSWLLHTPHNEKGHVTMAAITGTSILVPFLLMKALQPFNSLRLSDAYIRRLKVTIIVSDNGFSPGWRQAIIWSNAGVNWTVRNKLLNKIKTFSLRKIFLKMMSAKCCLFSPVLKISHI